MFKRLVKSHIVTTQKMPDVNPVFNQRLNFVYLRRRLLICLSSGDSLAEAGTTLARAEVLTLNGLGLLDNLLTLGQDELDVAGVGHVRVDLDRC